jgi:protein-tyrosine phosphatase
MNIVKHLNFHWRDMTAPTALMMMNLVQTALFEITSGGKIAVHCHAGFGRTGIAIAAILIANEGKSSDEAIKLVRSRR